MIKLEDVCKVGKILKPHGIKGEASIVFLDETFCDILEDNSLEYLILLLDGILVPFFFDEIRFTGKCSALVKFLDIDTKEKAKRFTSCDIYILRKFINLEDIEKSAHSLIGFTLFDQEREESIGTITSIDNTTINVLFNVTTKDGSTILIPKNENLIKEINIDKKYIKVAIPEGLLEIND